MATAESRAAAAYAALRATAAAAEATLASARAEAAAAEAAAAAARATVDAKVADAQAAAASMRRHPCHAFSGSPPFSLLDARGSLRLITDAVHEDDALCLALTCRALRDALWARFPRRPAGDALLFISTVRGCVTGDLAGARVRTRDAAVVGTVGRLAWAWGLDRPWPEPPEKFVRQCVRAYGVHDDDTRSGSVRQWHTCATAARHGALASLQWARANGCDWNEFTCSSAAEGGHLAVLQWARANGCEWNSDRPNGCEWNSDTCSQAAGGGHLAVLQWARANGCDWNENTCMKAARRGHLAVLQWARANGCDWDEFTCSQAAAGGHLAVLQWARDRKSVG